MRANKKGRGERGREENNMWAGSGEKRYRTETQQARRTNGNLKLLGVRGGRISRKSPGPEIWEACRSQLEEATCYSQEGFPVEGYKHQPTHKTLDPKFFLSKRNARAKMEQRLRACPTKNYLNLRPIPWTSTNP